MTFDLPGQDLSTRLFALCSVIDKQDGVRLLWSLLKSPNTEVFARQIIFSQ